MSFCQYFLCFAVFSFIGWAYETVYYSIQQRKFVNSGFLSTCFCPIYGMGAMLDLILLGWIENPLILFFAGMVVTCSLEYFVSWLLETLFHKRWWDYTGWPGNINGRVCLIGGIAFGTFTVALIKLIAPVTIDMIDSVSLPRGRRNRLISLAKKNRKFPLGNSLPYLSCVDFCRVRPGGRTLFLFVLISSESALRSEQR